MRPRPAVELAGVRPAALFGLFIAVLVPVVIVAVLVIGIGGSKSGGPKAAGSMSPTRMASTKPRGPMPVNLPLTAKTIAHYPLAKAVAGINVSVTAKGMLPLSSCKLTNSTTVACMQPTPAVDLVIFRTYRSLPALYAAYEARVSQLAQGPFRQRVRRACRVVRACPARRARRA